MNVHVLFSGRVLYRNGRGMSTWHGCDLLTDNQETKMNVTGTIDSILNEKGNAIWSIEPNATVYEAVKMMADKNVGALLVMEKDKLVGMFSERDYTRKVVLH